MSNPLTQPLIVYLPVARGEEPRAEKTLQLIAARSMQATEVVLVRIGGARPAAACPAAGGRPLRVVDAAADPRGPAYQALKIATAGPAHDVLLVRPGAELPPGWDARLRLAAYVGAGVGSVSPLSLEGLEIRADEAPGAPDVRAIDRYVYGRSRCRTLETDFRAGLCVYLRHDALAAVATEIAAYDSTGEGFLDFLARRIRCRGYCHALADHVFVGGREKLQAEPVILRMDAAAAGPARPHSLAPLAQTVCEAFRSAAGSPAIPGVDEKPVQLHLMHSWGGGLCTWVQDYSRAGGPGRVNLVLRPLGTPQCFAEGMALFRHVNDVDPLRQWRLDPPIPFTAIAHLQYRAILDEVIDAYGVGAVLVSSFVGHSLDVLRLDVPTQVVCHDYYPFCPALNIRFNGICTRCDRSRLAECLAENRYTHLLRRADPEYWAGLRERFVELVLERRIPMAAPSASVPRGMRTLDRRLSAADYHVVPHGMEQRPFQPVRPPDRRGKKLQAVILGRITPEKGADLLWDALDELAPMCDVTLLGCGDHGPRFRGRPGVRLVMRYEPAELPKLLAELAPDFGLLLSILPETFSYTLSELMCAGIPPVATNLGSFADRIDHTVTGFLFEPRKADFLRTVAMLHKNPGRLATVRRNLRHLRHRSLAEMLADYDRLLPGGAFCERLYVGARKATAAGPLPAPQSAPGEASGRPLDRILSEESFETVLDRVYEVFRRKLAHTPRLKNWQRPLVKWVVAGSYRLVKFGHRLGRRRPPPGRKAA